MKNTVATFAQAKAEGRKLAMLTAYDYSTAKLEDEAGIDGILIGDSLGNVVLGYEDTLSVTVEDMIHHSAAVARGAKNALIVCDMPFLSYEVSVPDAVRNAGRLLKEGRANCVKLEGGEEVCPQVAAIVAAGIPVMGHLGLTPQSINAFGGFKVQGKSEAAARKLISDAKALEAAGAFAIVLEAVPAKLAALVTKEVGVPTIGIGAGAGCDGQILVYQDMLGMFSDFCPKFVKRFANVGEAMRKFRKRFPDVGVSVQVPHELLMVPMDAILIEQVLSNLTENSVRHGKTTTRVEVSVQRDGKQARFCVRDNGCGIPPEQLGSLFDGTLKSSETASGDGKRDMGLGLMVCMTIVRAHGGLIDAKNLPGGGAEFSFCLPLTEEDDE